MSYKYNPGQKKKFPETDLYCITSQAHARGRTNLEVVAEMVRSGIKIIQYREKEKQMGEKYKECLKIREITKNAGIFFIVNDNLDLAIMTGADGLHLGQGDLPIEAAREMAGDELVIGISTHSPAQAEDALARGADYIGVGPIYRTFTKKDVCDPVGLDYLDYVVKNINLPFVAIGGIKESNVRDVMAHGASCTAMVTEIVGAENIQTKIADIRLAMKAE